MRIALFKNVAYGYESVATANKEGEFAYELDNPELVMLSEPMDIDFKMIESDKVVKAQVSIIENQITKVRADSEASITALNGRIAELLAIESDL